MVSPLHFFSTTVPSSEASKKENMVILNFPAVPVHFKLKPHFYNLMRLSYKLLPDNGVCLVNSLTHVEQFVLSKYLSSFYFIYVYDEHLVCIISFTFWLVQHSLCSAGWSWRLELEWCERKTLLPGWSWRLELD